MKDLDQRLLEGLREMGAAAEPPAGLYERARSRMVAYRRRVRIGAALVAGAILIAAVSMVPVVSRRAEEDRRPTPPTTVVATPTVGYWEVLAPAPLALTKSSAALLVWTGDSMLVWAEADARGARYNPVSRRWSRLADGPLTARQGSSAVWTGTEMLVWGGLAGGAAAGDAGAAYAPATNTWRRLARPPIRARAGHSAVWTGTEMMVWGGSGELPRQPSFADGAAYDPLSDRWRPLPQAPLVRRAGHTAVWTGKEMVLWGGRETTSHVGYLADGAAYEPVARTWRPLSSSPLAARSGHSAVWAGSRMVIWGGETDGGPAADGATWEAASGRWDTLPVAPLAPRSLHTGVWSGSEMLVWGGAGAGKRRYADGAVYDPDRASWRRLPGVLLPPRLRHGAVWTGTAMLVWGGQAPDEPPFADGAIFRLGVGPPPAKADQKVAGKLAGGCPEPSALEPTAKDVERFVDALSRRRTLGSGAEECVSAAALKRYDVAGSSRRDPAANPSPLCLYECGRAVVVEVRRAKDWLKGSAKGTYTATLQVVLEGQNSSDDRAEFVIEEVLTLGPGKTWSGRATRLVVQRAAAG